MEALTSTSINNPVWAMDSAGAIHAALRQLVFSPQRYLWCCRGYLLVDPLRSTGRLHVFGLQGNLRRCRGGLLVDSVVSTGRLHVFGLQGNLGRRRGGLFVDSVVSTGIV